jgi:hypothetical protein
MQEELQNELVIKPCTHTRLAAAYKVSPKVLRHRLRPFQPEIGQRSGYKYSLEQLFTIFEYIGLPQQSITTAGK